MLVLSGIIWSLLSAYSTEAMNLKKEPQPQLYLGENLEKNN